MLITKALLHRLVPMLPLLLLLVAVIPTGISWGQEECTYQCNPSPPATYVPLPPAAPGGYGAPPPPQPYSYYWPPYPYLAPPPPNWYYNTPPPPDPIWPFFPYYSRYPLHGSSDGFSRSPPQLTTTQAVTILACGLLLLGTRV